MNVEEITLTWRRRWWVNPLFSATVPLLAVLSLAFPQFAECQADRLIKVICRKGLAVHLCIPRGAA